MAGCGWYRLQLPFQALRHHYRWDVQVGGTADLGLLTECDVVVAQRTCLPGPSRLWQALAAMPDRPLMVYELDDDLFQVDPSNTGPAKLFNQPEIHQALVDNMKVADVVTVSTDRLALALRPHHGEIRVLPNCIPSWLTRRWLVHRGDPDKVTVGWQGSPTHDADWRGVDGQIARLVRQDPRVDLHLMGGHAPTLELAQATTRLSGWEKSVEDHYRRVDWDVALAPLANTPFNLSKSPIRLLEAAALGIPVVASAVGPYADWAEQAAGSLLLARQPHQWHSHTRRLVNEPETRHGMGLLARSVASRWTDDALVGLWHDLYTQTAPKAKETPQ